MTYKPPINKSSFVCAKVFWRLLAVFLMYVMLKQTAFALPGDAKQPVKLVADTATYNEKSGVTEYVGNVKITQGSLQMTASKLTINLNRDGSIRSATAIGSPARMQQQLSKGKELSKGSARRISYDAKTGIILLAGTAKLYQDGASIAGEEISYSLSAGDFEAKRGKSKQVELIIPPNPNLSLQSVR